MLSTERRDTVLLITLDRPEKRNALHPEMIRALSSALAQVEQDRSLGVVVITGAGKSFCAGLDLGHLASLNGDIRVAYLETFFSLFQQIYQLPQPVIAAVNGPAVAGGFDIAAACDLRVCSPEAMFAQTELMLGITQIMYPLYEIIGLGRAKELALTAEPISAEDAYRIGLVNHVYPGAHLLEEAWRLAQTIASRPRQAVFDTKRLSREVIEPPMAAAAGRMLAVMSERLRSEEHRVELERYVARLKRRI